MFSFNYSTNIVKNEIVDTPIFSPTLNASPVTYTSHTVTHTFTNTIYHNNINNLGNFNYNDYYNDYGVSYIHVVPSDDEIIENKIKLIPLSPARSVPKNSIDIITFDQINNNDILFDFKRDGKTEYDYGSYYKKESFINILKSNKNQFTLLELDCGSIVKYTALVIS
jgi:hypothetical protein